MERFYEVGKKTKTIEVTISYRIIQLFSEGLYSSPNKAIEELVCNAFDADAHNVHVILPSDYHEDEAAIVIIDDGESMNYKGLSEHWIIGRSVKEDRKITKNGRKRIGKFGIGKLATYVLANRLTHICKKDGEYYSVTMDYKDIPSDSSKGVYAKNSKDERVNLPFRELTEKQAILALDHWTKGTKKGYKAIQLFGKGSPKTWTVAVMSDLKEMIENLERGRLRWILSTAMPLREDFKLYLDGESIKSPKTGVAFKAWIIGKDITEKDIEIGLGDLTATEDPNFTKEEGRYGLSEPGLGRITGYIELYDDRLDTGKAADNYRSNGFFVYIRNRLINENDGHFGIGSNELSHGTFSRFRAIIYADKLNDELRSSREGVRVSEPVKNFRNLLKAFFNIARREWKKREEEVNPGEKFYQAISRTPYSLTQRPLISLLTFAFKGKARPRYLKYPINLSSTEKELFLQELHGRIEKQESLINESEICDLSQSDRIAKLDIENRILLINSLHPFVAHFLDEYESVKSSLPLELLAMSEVLLEASLYNEGFDDAKVDSIMNLRDELLRMLAKSTRKKSALLIAQSLQDAATNAKQLEIELVSAFNSLGFDAVPIGGKGKPDGIASAILSVDGKGRSQSYKVSIEAKSKEKDVGKVANSSVRISTIARQREDFKCNHAVIVGPDFPGDNSVLQKEIEADRRNTDGTITAIRIDDLARLVRLRPLKGLSLIEIRPLFQNCKMPNECKSWIDEVQRKEKDTPKYKDILEVIQEQQKKRPEEPVEFGAIAVALEQRGIVYPRSKIRTICESLQGMVPEYIACREDRSVELMQKPDIILDRIKAETGKFPESETSKSFLRNI